MRKKSTTYWMKHGIYKWRLLAVHFIILVLVESKSIPADEVMEEFHFISGMRMAEYNFWWTTNNVEDCARFCLEESRIYCRSFSYSESAEGCGTYENARDGAPEGIYGEPLGPVNGKTPSWGYYERKSIEYKKLEKEINRLKNLTHISVEEATDVLSGFDEVLRADLDVTSNEGSGNDSEVKVPVAPGELELMSEMLLLVVTMNPIKNASVKVSENFAKALINVSNSMVLPAHAQSWLVLQRDPIAPGIARIVTSSEIVTRDVSKRLLFYENSTSIVAKSDNVGMWMDIVEFSNFNEADSGKQNKTTSENTDLSEMESSINKKAMYIFPPNALEDQSSLENLSGDTGSSVLTGDIIMLPRTALQNRSVVTHVRYKGLSDVIPSRDANDINPRNGTTFKVNSAVLTTSVHPKPQTEIFKTEPVVIIFTHHRSLRSAEVESTLSPENQTNSSSSTFETTTTPNTIEESLHCVFWKEETDSTPSGWSTEGCELVSSNATHTICKCIHLTSFAVLLKMVDTSIEDDSYNTHLQALSWISYIGCALSLGGVLAMCGAFILLKFHTENMKIHFNLGVAVAAADIVFMFEELAQSKQYSCILVTVLLYYFNMALLSWMLIEGLFLYSQVVVVFVSARRWVKYYVLAGWGIPAIVMGISMGILNVQLGTNKICWLSPSDNSIWAFAAPAILVIVINFVILISVVRVIVGIQPDKTNNVTINKIRNGVKGSIFLAPLLGTTWLFGLLSLSRETLLFQYLFATTNSLQGFFLFVFHCLCNSEVRADFARRHKWNTSSSNGKSPPWFSGTFGLNVASGLRKFRDSISFEFASSSHTPGNCENSIEGIGEREITEAQTGTPKKSKRKLATIDAEETVDSFENVIKCKIPHLEKTTTSKSITLAKKKNPLIEKRENTSLSRSMPPKSEISDSEKLKEDVSSLTECGADRTELDNSAVDQDDNEPEVEMKKNILPPLPMMPIKNDVILNVGRANKIAPMSDQTAFGQMPLNQGARSNTFVGVKQQEDTKQAVCSPKFGKLSSVLNSEDTTVTIITTDVSDMTYPNTKKLSLDANDNNENGLVPAELSSGLLQAGENDTKILLSTVTKSEKPSDDKNEAYKIPMSYDSGLNSIDNESLLEEEYYDELVDMPYGTYRVGIHGCDIVL